MAITALPRMTLEEFSRLPEGPPYFEFENGELVPITSPAPEHQDGTDTLIGVIRKWVRTRKLGRVFRAIDVFLPDGRVYIPDISYLSARHNQLLSPIDRKIHGIPDLVVEITSSPPARDRIHKHRVYQDNQVPWYWIVDSDTLGIEEYRLSAEGCIRTAGVASGEDFNPGLFPGLAINLVSLLAYEDE